MHRLICILLLICLPLQSFAMQSGVLAAGPGNEHGFTHALAHAEEIEHHHHDEDGSLHFDDSDESVQHVHDHCSSAQAAFLAEPFKQIAPAQPASETGDATARYIPDPFLDSPLRPPLTALG